MKADYETNNLSNYLLIEESTKGRLIRISDILYVKADDNYCKFYLTSSEKIIVCRTLGSYEEQLDPNVFFRCHRSYIINILNIKEYFIRNNEFIIVLSNGIFINVARRRIANLKRLLRLTFF